MTPPKLLRTIAFSILTFLFAVGMGVNTSFAQTTYYVDTGGSDANNGLAATQLGGDGPLQTIGAALGLAADNDVISIAAGTYAENVPVSNTLTFEARTSGAQQVVRMNDLTINGSKTLTFAANAGNTFRANNINLTDGNIEAGSSVLALLNGGTITRTEKSVLNGTLDFPTNVNVTYSLAAAISSGDELPSDLGSGTLTVNTTAAGDVLTLAKSVTAFQFVNAGGGDGIDGDQTVTVNSAGNAVTISNDFAGNLVVNTSNTLTLQGDVTGDVTVNGPAASATADLNLAGTGSVTGNVLLSQSSSSAGSGIGDANIGGDVTGNVTTSNAGSNGTGAVNLGNSAVVDGSVNSADAVVTAGDETVTGNITAATAVNLGTSASVEGDITAGGVVNVGNGAVVEGNVNPGGNTTLGDAASTIEGTLTTSNDISGPGEIANVDLTGSTPAIGGSPVITGTLNVNGSTVATASADFKVKNVNINDSATLNVGANTLTIEDGSFVTSGTGSLVNNNATILAFTGNNESGDFSPNPNFAIGAVTVNKTGQAITVNNNFRVNNSAAAALTVTDGTLNLRDYIATIGADGDVSVASAGEITSNTPTEGGVFFVANGATIAGEGYSNVLINAGVGNNVDLAADVVFSGNLTFVTGNIGTSAYDISPENSGQLVTVNPENSNGVVAPTTFNGAGLGYNLKYEGALTANQTIGNELTSDVVNVTVATSMFPVLLPQTDVTIQNLTVNKDAILQADDNAARTITIEGVLTVQEDGTLWSANANTTTFDLAGDGSTHHLNGVVNDMGSEINFNIVGDNVTVKGSGTEDASNNWAESTFTVDGKNATVADLQFINAVTVNKADAGLTLNLIKTDKLAAPNDDYGVVKNGATVIADASLTLSSATAIVGGNLKLADDATLAMGGNELYLPSDNADIEGDAIVTSTGGYLHVDGGILSADDNSLPYVRINGTVNEDLTVSENLIVTAGGVSNAGATVTLDGNMTTDDDVMGGSLVANGGTITASTDVTFTSFTVDGNLELNSSTAASRTFIITNAYTHTSGDVELNKHTLFLDDIDLSLTAGSYTSASKDGGIDMNSTTARNIDTGDSNLSVPNLTISGANDVSLTAKDELTIQYGLNFENTGDLDATVSTDADVIIADDATITRDAAGTLAEAPTFAGETNLVYNAALTTSDEAPSTANNVDVNANVALGASLEVTGLLALSADLTDGGNDLLLSSGSSIEMEAGGTLLTSVDTNSDDYTVIYRTGGTLDIGNLELAGSDITLVIDDKNPSSITRTLNANADFKSVTTGEADVFGLGSSLLSVAGDLSLTNGSITSAGPGAGLLFNGTTEQTLTVTSSEVTLPNDVNVELDNDAGMKLEGGNLTMGGGTSNFKFTDGLFRTGDNVLTLRHNDTSDQGFTRPASGHVVGNVAKMLPTTGSASNRVEFPVGAEEEDGSRTYSPLVITFNDPSQVPNNVTMTVNHESFDPSNVLAELGTKGFPIDDGVEEGVHLARYPDRFRWTVKTSTTLSPSLVYDMEVERENYSAYSLTGEQADVEDLRIIRRANGNIDNPWRLQGDAAKYLQSYQTGTFPNVHPTVVVQDVEGGILGGNGTVFTYALKSNMEGIQPADLVANKGQERKVAFQDLFKGGTGEYTYDISGNDDDVASYTVANDTLHITAAGEGSTSFTIKATDVLNDSRTVVQNITVNTELMVSNALSDTTVNQGTDVELALGDYFAPGTGSLSYAISSDSAAIATASETGGMLTVTAVAPGTTTITVQATDGTSASVSDSFEITVNGPFAADAGNAVADTTLRAGDNKTQAPETFDSVTDVTSLFVGGTAPFSYSATSSDDAIASATISNDSLMVAATGSHVDSDSAKTTITVTATDKLGTEASATFEVATIPAYGDVNANNKSEAGDARKVLRTIVGLEDPFTSTMHDDVADVDQNGSVNAFDAAIILRYAVQLSGYETLPYSASPKSSIAELTYGKAVTEDGVVTIPLNIEGNGVVAVEFSGEYNASSVTFESLSLNGLPEDWSVAQSTDEEGKIKLALAGITSISSSEIAKISFKLNDNNSDVALRASGFVNNIKFAKDELSVQELPESFALEQNYPNPFNPTTNVRYSLPASADVTIELFSINGQKVQTLVNKRQDAGSYTMAVNGSNFASGIYIYRITAKSNDATFTSVKKMTLIK